MCARGPAGVNVQPCSSAYSIAARMCLFGWLAMSPHSSWLQRPLLTLPNTTPGGKTPSGAGFPPFRGIGDANNQGSRPGCKSQIFAKGIGTTKDLQLHLLGLASARVGSGLKNSSRSDLSASTNIATADDWTCWNRFRSLANR